MRTGGAKDKEDKYQREEKKGNRKTKGKHG